MLLIFSFTVLAQDFPICRREREIARYKSLARTLTNDEASSIVNAQAHIYQLRKARRNENRVACNCDNANQGLKDLITFIEDDYSTIRSNLLGQTNAAEEAAANSVAQAAYSACETRGRADNLRLLNEAKLSYSDRAPAGTTAMAGFNVEGLRGFIRDRVENGQRIKTFAFAGSQTLFDWWTNLTDKGGSQLAKAMELHLRSTVEFVKNGGKIECTGHSLGGAVAEGFCAAVMRYVRYEVHDFGDYQKDNRIKVVTFNGLGAADTYKSAMKKRNGPQDKPVDAKSWLTANTIHYRVEGDPLASVGASHLYGEVIEKASNRTVTKLGSAEATGFMNALRSARAGITSLFDNKNIPTQPDIRGPQTCRASENPLEAHDIKSCYEIANQANGWRVSQVETTQTEPQI